MNIHKENENIPILTEHLLGAFCPSGGCMPARRLRQHFAHRSSDGDQFRQQAAARLDGQRALQAHHLQGPSLLCFYASLLPCRYRPQAVCREQLTAPKPREEVLAGFQAFGCPEEVRSH